jgi:hypothetical protein
MGKFFIGNKSAELPDGCKLKNNIIECDIEEQDKDNFIKSNCKETEDLEKFKDVVEYQDVLVIKIGEYNYCFSKKEVEWMIKNNRFFHNGPIDNATMRIFENFYDSEDIKNILYEAFDHIDIDDNGAIVTDLDRTHKNNGRYIIDIKDDGSAIISIIYNYKKKHYERFKYFLDKIMDQRHLKYDNFFAGDMHYNDLHFYRFKIKYIRSRTVA